MAGSDPQSLEQRVARLERLVEKLLDEKETRSAPGGEPAEKRAPGSHQWSWQREGAAAGPDSAGGRAAGDRSASDDGDDGAEPVADPGPKSRTWVPTGTADLADQGERWLGRVGIAFVVLAFGFLFKYAFDQGWIGPTLRLVLGFVAATGMLGVGLRLEGSRERYSQYLLGGAVAVYYMVGYAAYEIYALIPFAIAFAFMCGVTVLSFVLAERQRLPSLAVIGAGGGLSTPFLVNRGSGSVPELVLYTTLLLAGAGALQFLRGWRTLLLVLGLGGLAVMALAVDATSGPEILEAAFTVVGILVAGSLFGIFPLFRAHLHRTDPEGWPESPLPRWAARAVSPEQVALLMLRIGCVLGAFVAVLELGALFSAERETFGLLYGAAFLVYLGLAYALIETRIALNASAEATSILLILAVSLSLFDYRIMLPLAVAAAAMHTAHQRLGLPGVRVIAHLVFAELLLLLVGRLDVLGMGAGSPFGMEELGALGAIVLALTTSFVLTSPGAKVIYRVAAHVGFLVWLATQLGPLERGQELVSLSWGIYGIALFLLSLRLHERGVQLAGLFTLGVVAAKLLVVDMAQIDLIWRILLFMGFGAAFLGLSYLIKEQAREG